MPKNIATKIIGYYDEDGFAYCAKHARDRSESIPSNATNEECCICGEKLNDLIGSS